MVQAQPQLRTFADYLAYTNGMDGYYELTNGVLIEIIDTVGRGTERSQYRS